MAYGAASSATQEKAARVSVLVDESGKVMKVYEADDAAGHAEAVLADLSALS